MSGGFHGGGMGAAMAAAEAAIANVSEKLPFVARQGCLLNSVES
jgi:hypothetical protein